MHTLSPSYRASACRGCPQAPFGLAVVQSISILLKLPIVLVRGGPETCAAADQRSSSPSSIEVCTLRGPNFLSTTTVALSTASALDTCDCAHCRGEFGAIWNSGSPAMVIQPRAYGSPAHGRSSRIALIQTQTAQWRRRTAPNSTQSTSPISYRS